MLHTAARRHRMNRVANYIRANLSDSLNLEKLAEYACLSKFQFIRAFEYYYQETPMRQLSRLRLEYGARSLVFENEKSITHIAMGFGYATSQNFSGAFHRHFGVAPRVFRKNNPTRFVTPEQIGPGSQKFAQIETMGQTDHWRKSQVQVEMQPPIRVAYIRNIGAYWIPDSGIEETYDKLEMWARSKGLWRSASKVIGICPDSSAVTPEGYCAYDACLPVSDNIQEDDVVSIQTIPAGTFAKMAVDSYAKTKISWQWLVSNWINEENVGCCEFYEAFSIVNEQWNIEESSINLCIRLKHVNSK